MKQVIVIGALGKMGRTVCAAVVAEADLELAAAVDISFSDEKARAAFGLGGVPLYHDLATCLSEQQAEVAVDFTIPDMVYGNVLACLKKGVHCVVGTTGLTEEQLAGIEGQAVLGSARCFIAPNFAIGAVLLMEVSRHIARYLPDCEIIELHHDQKLDAPSGTALRTADLLAAARLETPQPQGPEGNSARGWVHRGIPIHSVRLPGLVAHQEVVFGGQGQTLTVRHDSISRESFMPGVVLAVRRVAELNEPLVVGLENIL